MSVREIFYTFIRGLLGDEEITPEWIEENDGHIIDEALTDIKAELKDITKTKGRWIFVKENGEMIRYWEIKPQEFDEVVEEVFR